MGDPTTHMFFHECWQCSGEGVVYMCCEEFACIDPESGCDDCARKCGICYGKGGWHSEQPPEEPCGR